MDFRRFIMSVNFVGKLHEKFQAIGIYPKYTLMSVIGAAHNPCFRYQVKLGDYETVGSGRSKKAAKNAAAEAMLSRLDQESPYRMKLSSSLGNLVQMEDEAVLIEDTIDSLSALCNDSGFQKPKFVEQPGSNSSERVIFSCQVGNVMKIGEGESAINAKNAAAEKVITVLRSLTVDPISSLNDLCNEQGFRIPEFRCCSGTNQEVTIECTLGHLTSKSTSKDMSSAKAASASKMINILNSMKGGSVRSSSVEPLELKSSMFSSDTDNNNVNVSTVLDKINEGELYHSFVSKPSLKKNERECTYASLEELCKVHNIEATCVKLKIDEIKNVVACIVQVNTVPVIVGFSMNEDVNTSKKKAERDVLNYLNMLTTTK